MHSTLPSHTGNSPEQVGPAKETVWRDLGDGRQQGEDNAQKHIYECGSMDVAAGLIALDLLEGHAKTTGHICRRSEVEKRRNRDGG